MTKTEKVFVIKRDAVLCVAVVRKKRGVRTWNSSKHPYPALELTTARPEGDDEMWRLRHFLLYEMPHVSPNVIGEVLHRLTPAWPTEDQPHELEEVMEQVRLSKKAGFGGTFTMVQHHHLLMAAWKQYGACGLTFLNRDDCIELRQAGKHFTPPRKASAQDTPSDFDVPGYSLDILVDFLGKLRAMGLLGPNTRLGWRAEREDLNLLAQAKIQLDPV
jgi:hypothetical protein